LAQRHALQVRRQRRVPMLAVTCQDLVDHALTQQTIDGALIAPSGTISITTTASDIAFFLGDNAPYRSIWLGSSSLLDASGRVLFAPDRLGITDCP